MKFGGTWLMLVGVLVAPACGAPAPRAIQYGEELCDRCQMTIVDPAYAAQLVTVTGKVHVFDDVGDLAAFVEDGQVPADQIYGLWVNRFLDPDDRISVDSAVFLRSEGLHTPMASGLAAFRSRRAADSLRALLGGDLLTWAAVRARADTPLGMAGP